MQPYQHDAATIDVIQNTAAIEDDRTDSIDCTVPVIADSSEVQHPGPKLPAK